jgi:hypothetical protein
MQTTKYNRITNNEREEISRSLALGMGQVPTIKHNRVRSGSAIISCLFQKSVTLNEIMVVALVHIPTDRPVLQ